VPTSEFDTPGQRSLRSQGMRSSVRQHVLAGVLLLGAGLARAQAPAKPSTTTLERAADVPDAEKIKRSAAAVSRMRTVLSEVLGRLEEARATKDVVKLNCVNEKLTQVKGLLRISEQSDVALQEAVVKKDSTAAEHEYSKVSIAKTKVDQLGNESQQCIGQLAFRTDENLTVEVEVPGGLPTEDPTNPPRPEPPTNRPPPASPIL
jgi:copper chaperone CopZ